MVGILQILVVLFVFQINSEIRTSTGFILIRKFQDKQNSYVGSLLGKKIGDQLYSDLIVVVKRKMNTDTLYAIRKSSLYNSKGWGGGVGNSYDGYRIDNIKSDSFDYFLWKKDGPSSDSQTIVWNESRKIFEVFKDEP